MGILKSCIPQWMMAAIYTNNSMMNNLAVLNDITDKENNVKIMNFELKVPKMQLQTNSEISHLNVSFD